MVKIWKYNIPGHCEGKIKQVLNVKTQYGKPVVWVMLDDAIEQYRALDFYTIGTGWELTGGDEQIIRQSAYIGTVKDEEGFIWHCFCVPVDPVEKKEEDSAAADDAIVETEPHAEG